MTAAWSQALKVSFGFCSDVSLELGRFQVPEGLFHPEAWGLDNLGVQKMVHKAIQVGYYSLVFNHFNRLTRQSVSFSVSGIRTN